MTGRLSTLGLFRLTSTISTATALADAVAVEMVDVRRNRPRVDRRPVITVVP